MAQSLPVTLVPALSVGAYSANDVLGVPMLIQVPQEQLDVTLGSIAMVDKASVKAPIDLLFFDALPAVAVDNDPFDMTDAVALSFLGSVSIAADRYIDSASNSEASLDGIGKLMASLTSTGKIYMVAVIRGTGGTYGAVDALQFRLSFYRNG